MLQGIYFFIIGAFAGWLLEVIFKIINNNLKDTPGMLHGPFCILYGAATVILSLVITNVTQSFFLLFIICMVISTILEYITYVLLDKIYDQTTPNMIQRISGIFERNPLIYGDI